jgi:hypothetical protein
MLQGGRLQIPDEDLSIAVKPSSRTMGLVFTQPGIFLRVKGGRR